MNITFHLVSCRGNLNIFAPNALRDIELLVKNIDSPSEVTEKTIDGWFMIDADIAFACDDGRMIGMATLFPFKDCFAFIENVSVFPEYQRQGIATKLINMLFIASRLFHNANHVELRCSRDNISARNLYQSLGFFIHYIHENAIIYRHTLGREINNSWEFEWPYYIEDLLKKHNSKPSLV